MLFHAGQFDDAPQLDFAPSATHLGRAQGLHELPRLRFEPLLPIGQARQVGRELAALLLAARFHVREGLLDLLERAAHRIQHGLDVLLAFRQIVLGISLERFELGGGQIEETRRVRIQRRCGQRREGLLHPLLGVLVGRQPLLKALALLRQFGRKLPLPASQRQQIGGRGLDVLLLREHPRLQLGDPLLELARRLGGGLTLGLQRGVETRTGLHRRRQFAVDPRFRLGNGERDGLARPAARDEPAPEESQNETGERAEDEVQRNRHGPLMMDRAPPAVKNPAGLDTMCIKTYTRFMASDATV